MPQRRRTMPKRPLQVVSCLIFDENNRLLLLQRHAKDLGGGLWAAPGGTQEPGEHPRITVLREVQEETGLALPDAVYLGKHKIRMPHGTVDIATFRATVSGGAAIAIDPFEHERYRWFALSALLETEHIIWGLPTTLVDFGLMKPFGEDPTLADGSNTTLLEAA